MELLKKRWVAVVVTLLVIGLAVCFGIMKAQSGSNLPAEGSGALDAAVDTSSYTRFLYDQADLLSRITCPTVYLKAQTSYGEDGTLFAANSDEDAARVQQLIACCETTVIESGHDIHYEHPDAFAKAVNEAAGKSSGWR